ncbi:MAG: glycoside hydrolase family 3 protein [Vicinamibacterales bacterium]
MRRIWLAVSIVALLLAVGPGAQSDALDREQQRWVDTTVAAMSIDQQVGQLIFDRLASTYLPSDSDEYERLVRLVHEVHIGGIVAFGGTVPVPRVRLNEAYGSIILGQPLEVASLLNRLQAIAPVPLLTAADFEWGAGMRIEGATKFPRAMAFGAAGDPALAEAAGRITGEEGRAMGLHVDFAPVADVNNNPRNPVINIRSFGEDPDAVGRLAAAFARGVAAGGMLPTLKHFPGHGDTDTDSHLGLPVIPHGRDRLEALELRPFRTALPEAAGVMVAHIELPAIDRDSGPATFSQPIVTGLLRGELGFDGLVVSDAMRMDAIARMVPPGEAAVRAVLAGVDVLIDFEDPRAAFDGLREAVASGRLPRARLEASVRRILAAKARMGLHRTRGVNLESVPLHVGGRAHEAVAREVAERAITLVRDTRNQVPLGLARDARVLYLSVLDYPSNWGTGAPSRAVIPTLRDRWPDLEAIELSDRSTPAELELVRTMAEGFDAVIAGVFVRAASASGRLDLPEPLAALLQDLARDTTRRRQAMAAVIFGNPYVAASLPGVPAVLVTYDLSDHAERAAVKALAGEIPIRGRLPIALGEGLPVGFGLDRPGPAGSSGR